MKRTAGGSFDPEERNVYFSATNTFLLRYSEGVQPYILMAVNEISEKTFPILDDLIEKGAKFFIDSGIFWLTNEHMRAHGITMDEALALPPEEIDGFDDLFEKYIEIVKRYEDRCWGYIELDQGGIENKKKTRARLEGMGLRPIPVYHPLNDGWAYFDELAGQYDRICFGNVVQASRGDRKRLVATAWERKRQYPNLWIHLLGMTPNQILNAYPMDSCDSSSWIQATRWPMSWASYAMQRKFSRFPPEFRYLAGEIEGEGGTRKSNELAAYQFSLLVRNWRSYLERGQAFDLWGEETERQSNG